MNTEETQRKKNNENFNLKTRYWFHEISQKHSIHNSWDLPKF